MKTLQHYVTATSNWLLFIICFSANVKKHYRKKNVQQKMVIVMLQQSGHEHDIIGGLATSCSMYVSFAYQSVPHTQYNPNVSDDAVSWHACILHKNNRCMQV